MNRYRKKPVEVSAVQLVPGNDEAIRTFVQETGCPFEVTDGYEMTIHTLEGDMQASLGDWVIQGVQGEFYPCKPGIFAATYDAVLDD